MDLTKLPKTIKGCAIAAAICTCVDASAQVPMNCISSWDFTSYSDATVANLTADKAHWTYNSKGRFMNAVPTDGKPLTANGVEIAETKGIIISEGIKAGSFLLRHAMGDNNGMQIEPQGSSVTVGGLRKGDELRVTFMSSSKNSRGIQSVANLDGAYGESSYIGPSPKEFTFRIIDNGEASYTFSGGVVVRQMSIWREKNPDAERVPAPTISISSTSRQVHNITRDIKEITLTCPEPDAKIFYSLVDSPIAADYAVEYTGTFTIDRSCRLQTYAMKEGMRTSEIAVEDISVPFVLPFAGEPYVLDPEPLDRAAVATRASGKFLINWRLLITDPDDIRFNVYRDGTKLNDEPLYVTNYLDDGGTRQSVYTIEVLSGSNVIETVEAKSLLSGIWSIPIDRPEGGSTQSGKYEYVPGDCMVADLDGDHVYEIVMKWDPTNADDDNSSSNDIEGAGQKDNSISGYTANVLIDAYRLDGTKLWRIDLGRNIRAGAHYTQLMVYDLDGDGRAEVACKTAPGTVDAEGKYVVLGSDDPSKDYRNSRGGITQGPEYLTVFEGLTGKAIATTAYLPARNIQSNWGDSYGNRSERYLACVAYLDGEHPSLVMCRGYYTAAYLWAVDFNGQELTTRWLHSSDRSGVGAFGEGAHSISTADVDGDGCDEIIFGSCTLDNDGTILYRTGLGHGDALHVGDFHPDRPGLEVMMVHEDISAKYGIEMRDALTGEIISGKFAGADVGRGLCADIDPETRGCEYWGLGNEVFDAEGNVISTRRPTINFRTYWDGDVYEELTEKGTISKWSATNSSTLLAVSGSNAGTNLIKATPCLQADIFGDWREEQIYYDDKTKSRLMIFATPYVTEYRIPCLMHDHHYRMATVWQTSGYNQPPHLSYYLPDYVEKKSSGGVHDVTVDAASHIVCYRYYDISSRLLPSRPESGFCIRETLFENGTVLREKIFE